MPALAMILTAVLVVPGDVPERESCEVEQGLDLRGDWEGTIIYKDNRTDCVTLAHCRLIVWSWSSVDLRSWKMREEGRGKFRVVFDLRDYLGIYEWRGDTVVLCIRPMSKGRPMSFQAGDGRTLLILHRVKPRK
jgi:hypothetical protein